MALALSALLTHQLATDEAASSNLALSRSLQQLQTHRWISVAQAEADATDALTSEKAASVVHRWQLRITSLVNSKSSTAAQAAGFAFALETSRQSVTLFYQYSKPWYNQALTLLSRKTQSPSNVIQAIVEFLLFSFEKASHSQEYAREVANPAGVRKLGDALLLLAGSDASDLYIRLYALNSLCRLIRISASPLRPLAQQLQSLSVILLCKWSEPSSNLPEGQKAAANLLGYVYITAGKAQAGNAWRKTIEGLIGSAHQCITPLVSTLIEEVGPAANLAALDMPPLSQSASSSLDQAEPLYPALHRLEALQTALSSMLGSVTERAVPVPVGALVALAERLLSVSMHSPTRERHDPGLHASQTSLLPRLHVLACKMLARISKILGTYLTAYSTRILGQISLLMSTYPVGSSIRCSLIACTAVLASTTHIHPEEGSKHLSKIVRGILEDAAILADPEEGRKAAPKPAVNGASGGERKSKRMKMYDTGEEALGAGRRMLDVLEVACIRNELASLHSLLASSPWLLSPAVLNLTLRFLLALTLSPFFFSFAPAPSSLLSSALSLAPLLRSTVLSCLVSALRSPSARDAPGSLELASQAFRNGIASNVSTSGEKAICQEGLDILESTLRPNVPPLLRTRGMRLGMLELAGGPLDQRKPKEVPSEDQPQKQQNGYDGRTFAPATFRPAPTATDQPAIAPAASASIPPPAVEEAMPTLAVLPTAMPLPSRSTELQNSATVEQPPAPASVMNASTPVELPGIALKPSAAAVPNPRQAEDVSMAAEVESATRDGAVAEAEKTEPSVSRSTKSVLETVDLDSDSDDDAPMPQIVMSDSE